MTRTKTAATKTQKRRTGTKTTARRTAGKTAKGKGKATLPEVTLSTRTRGSALGKWIARREAIRPGFWNEVNAAFTKVSARNVQRVATVMPRHNGGVEATQH